ncbi:hypothetical protein ACTXT7_017037 [Hymenolepis weldensis]
MNHFIYLDSPLNCKGLADKTVKLNIINAKRDTHKKDVKKLQADAKQVFGETKAKVGYCILQGIRFFALLNIKQI